MRFVRSVLLATVSIACPVLLAGCELVLDPNSLVGKQGAAGHAGELGGPGGDASGGEAGSASTAGGGKAGSGKAGAGSSGDSSGGGSAAGTTGDPGQPGQPGTGNGGSSSCQPSNGGTEICDGLDNDCDPNTPDCPAGCQAFTAQSTTYMACGKVVKWQVAQLTCLQQSMELIEIDSAQQNAAVVAELQALAIGPYVWLGAQDTNGNSNLTWPDGTVLARGSKIQLGVYQNFGAGEPEVFLGSSRCLQMGVLGSAGAGIWSASSCADTEQFVCAPLGASAL